MFSAFGRKRQLALCVFQASQGYTVKTSKRKVRNIKQPSMSPLASNHCLLGGSSWVNVSSSRVLGNLTKSCFKFLKKLKRGSGIKFSVILLFLTRVRPQKCNFQCQKMKIIWSSECFLLNSLP